MMSPLGWLYGKIINLRNAGYKKGTLKSYDLGAPTISVGNITVGGTGKTPLVSYVANLLIDRGETVCVISRGYKRKNEKTRVLVSDGETILSDVKKAGDEPFELATKLKGKAIVISDADRVAAGKWAFETFGVTAFVLDDAFQHQRANRDLDILVIDATNSFGNRKPIPSGILREPNKNIDRADLVIVTRANLARNIEELSVEIRELNSSAPIIVCENKVVAVTLLKDFLAGRTSKETTVKDQALAFCALGNPDNFFDQLASDGFDLVSKKAFRDHHHYIQKDLAAVENEAKACDAKILLTTAKDAVKLSEMRFEIPCYVVETRLLFDKEKELQDKIHAILKK